MLLHGGICEWYEYKIPTGFMLNKLQSYFPQTMFCIAIVEVCWWPVDLVPSSAEFMKSIQINDSYTEE